MLKGKGTERRLQHRFKKIIYILEIWFSEYNLTLKMCGVWGYLLTLNVH